MNTINVYLDSTVYFLDGKVIAFIGIYAGDEAGVPAVPCGAINVKFDPVVGKRFTECPYITINPHRIHNPPICGSNPKWPGKRVYLPRPNNRVDVRPIVVCARNCGLKCVGRECQALEPVSYGAL